MNELEQAALVTPDHRVSLVCPLHDDLRPQDAAHVAMVAPLSDSTQLTGNGSQAEAQRQDEAQGHPPPVSKESLPGKGPLAK